MNEVARKVQQRVSRLPQGLQDHIYRVGDLAVELAPHHGVDPEQARLGALAHDVARAMPGRELLKEAVRLGVPMGLVDRQLPVLLHGPVGAELLRREDGLEDQPLHQAVYWHTTAHPSLDSLGKVVFLADKLDPQKAPRYPFQPYLKELAIQDLDRAVLEFVSREVISLAQQGQMVHPTMVEARNHLLASMAQHPGSIQ